MQQRSIVWCIAAVSCWACGCGAGATSGSQPGTQAPGLQAPRVKFEAAVPQPPAPGLLPRYRLVPSEVPEAFATANGAPPPAGLTLANDKERGRTNANKETSEFRWDSPVLRSLPRSPNDREPDKQVDPKLIESARALLADRRLVAPDGFKESTVELASVRMLHHVRRDLEAKSSPSAAPVAVYATVLRRLNGLRVDGPGSRLALTFDLTGKLRGLTYRWKTVQQLDPAAKEEDRTVAPTGDRQSVEATIEKLLAPALEHFDVVVQDIDLRYYDGHGDWLQPAYRFVAQLQARGDRGLQQEPVTLVGFVPYGETKEPIPTFGVDPKLPDLFDARAAKDALGAAGSQQNGALSVGRYVIENDHPGFVSSAVGFWSGLSQSRFAGSFASSQYFFLTDSMFTTEKDVSIDAVDVALIETHGSHSKLLTSRAGAIVPLIDLVNYGRLHGGRLRELILHSCATIEAPLDNPEHWSDPWFKFFGGASAAVGYRSLMYINDGASEAYAEALGSGAPPVSAWLSTVAALDAYSDDAQTCRMHKVVPMGRAAAVMPCGTADSPMFNEMPSTPTTCLDIWWFDDQLNGHG